MHNFMMILNSLKFTLKNVHKKYWQKNENGTNKIHTTVALFENF
jgi:hypothetical protein